MPTAPFVRYASIFADMFRVDLSNADVIFVNNAAFDETLNARLLRKLHLNTRPGTIVFALADIPHVGSRGLLKRRPNDPACFFTHEVCACLRTKAFGAWVRVQVNVRMSALMTYSFHVGVLARPVLYRSRSSTSCCV